ncbi:glycosyltransferase family 25 protein [Mesorhizobium sp. YIM 152430]|uniref:glycosyltransferase family 25 protein n=1 Tax=Mesorhizobium sp. YIM 152430 TaxID=3031761 RepID=UPI0023DA5F2D|nr:glycosyltransferase family 25 protein [Mesorhizobium sp. YIM 152430]MDF1598508.1 glycosyltransferase family 25 protein [Mesorhizobium sp. YIM 152430]
MLILVINLDRAPERLAHMGREFGRIGVAFTRLAATDGQGLGLDDRVNALEGRRLSRGETACFISHRRCWQVLVESGESHGVVLEDDVFFGEGAAPFFLNADWFPKEAGIVKLETYLAPTRIAKAPVANVEGREVHLLTGRHLGAGAYALDAATARMLVEASAAIDRQVDDFLFDPEGEPFARARVHQLVPAVAIQGLKLGKLKRIEGEARTYQSQLYDERLTTRRKLGTLAKIRREIVSGISKGAIAIAGRTRTLFGPTRWGRIPFR